MRIKFRHQDYEFEVSAGDPPPCNEEEQDRNFEQTLSMLDRFPTQPTVHHTTSWIVARLAALTYGDIQQINDGYFHNDGGSFGYRMKVSDKDKRLVGRFGMVFYYDRIHFAGFRIGDTDIRKVLLDLLVSNPDDLSKCEIHSQCGETKGSEYFGFDGYNLR